MHTMIGEWDGVVFTTVPHKESGVHILTHLDDIQAQLEEHIVKVQAMRGSAFVKLIEEEVKDFYFLLLRIQSTIEEWTKVLLKSSSYFSLTCTLNFSNRDVELRLTSRATPDPSRPFYARCKCSGCTCCRSSRAKTSWRNCPRRNRCSFKWTGYSVAR